MSYFKYQQSIFKVEAIGVDVWRWTILPHHRNDLTLVGQEIGARQRAIDHCKFEVARMADWKPRAASRKQDSPG